MPVALTSDDRHDAWLVQAWALVRWPSMGGPLVLSVAGWALMWAVALGIVDLGPVWVPAALFLIGLALVPVAASSTARRCKTAGQLRSPLNPHLQVLQEYGENG